MVVCPVRRKQHDVDIGATASYLGEERVVDRSVQRLHGERLPAPGGTETDAAVAVDRLAAVAFWNRKESEPEPVAPAGPFEMTIEDVFSITGRGTVVTGRVTSGVVRVGMPVTVNTEPQPVSTTVTGVEQFRKKTDQAGAGETVGLLLDGVGRDDVAPGNVVSG